MACNPRTAIDEWCSHCVDNTEHVVLGCIGRENDSKRREAEGPYEFIAHIQCVNCETERDLRTAGDWEGVVAYLVERRLGRWISQLHPDRSRPTSVSVNEAFLEQATPFVRNASLEARMLVETGTAIEASSAIAFFLAAACDQMEVSGRLFSERVEHLMMSEINIAKELRDPIGHLMTFGDMRVRQMIGLSRGEMLEVVGAIESILMSHWAMSEQA